MSIFQKKVKAKEVINFDKQQIKHLIDIRENLRFKEGHINGSRNVSMAKLLQNTSAFIKQDEEYYILCDSGFTSRNVISQLKKQGYSNLINVKGGYTGYQRALDKSKNI